MFDHIQLNDHLLLHSLDGWERLTVQGKDSRVVLLESSGGQKTLKKSEVESLSQRHKLIFGTSALESLGEKALAKRIQDLSRMSEASLSEGRRRMQLVSKIENLRLAGIPTDRKAILIVLREEENCSLSGLKKWLRAAREADFHREPRLIVLTPADRLKGRRRTNPQELDAALSAHIKTRFSRESANQLYQRAPLLIKDAISYNTFRKRLKEQLSPYQQRVQDVGKSRADEEFRVYQRRRDPEYCLDEAEIDDHLLPFYVKLSTGHVLRPWITVIIDRKSRMVLGCHLGLASPSIDSNRAALTHMLVKKHVKSFGVAMDWPCYGLPGVLISDQASYNRSKDRVRIAADIGLKWRCLPPATPQRKGRLERFFGTLCRQAFAGEVGAFRKNDEKDRARAAKQANRTLTELRLIILKWVVDVYQVRPHLGIGGKKSPRQRWDEENRRIIAARLLAGNSLQTVLERARRLTIGKLGISLKGAKYFSRHLTRLQRQFGPDQSYDVVWDPKAPGVIFVVDPTNGDPLPAYAQATPAGSIEALLQEFKEDDIGTSDKFSKRLDKLARAFSVDFFTPPEDYPETYGQVREPIKLPREPAANRCRSTVPTARVNRAGPRQRDASRDRFNEYLEQERKRIK